MTQKFSVGQIVTFVNEEGCDIPSTCEGRSGTVVSVGRYNSVMVLMPTGDLIFAEHYHIVPSEPVVIDLLCNDPDTYEVVTNLKQTFAPDSTMQDFIYKLIAIATWHSYELKNS